LPKGCQTLGCCEIGKEDIVYVSENAYHSHFYLDDAGHFGLRVAKLLDVGKEEIVDVSGKEVDGRKAEDMKYVTYGTRGDLVAR